MSDIADGVPNRGMITASVMLATILTSLDTTIANVALPHMAGSLQASADQITWVLTSYIVAAAVMTPMAGWLARRFGRKMVFLVSIAGFTATSMMCGAAQSLGQVVVFRLLQGAFGAALVPLSQAVMLDINPPERQGSAMALWGMGTLLGPIAGPALGGWLTDNMNWRWVFYINFPFGIIAFLGVLTFITNPRFERPPKFDFLGFIFLAVSISAFQLFLDRGDDRAWFESAEIWIEASIAGVAMLLFIFHTITADHPFLPRSLFSDPNFVTGTAFGFFIGAILFSTLALLPPLIETLMGYPVVTTGLVTAPRGVGSMIAMFIVGRVIGRVDSRLIIVVGLLISAVAIQGMASFTLQMGSSQIVWSGLVQGIGFGLIFVPLNMLAFGTLPPMLRGEGAAANNLVRNMGSSAGISVMQAFHTRHSQMLHSSMTEHLRPDNPLMRAPWLHAPYSLTNPVGIALLNNEVGRQASMIAYVDDFHLMFLMVFALMPALLLMRKPSRVEGHATLSAE